VPAHEEQVAGFFINKHPTTNAEFRRFIKDTGCRTKAEINSGARDFADVDAGDLVSWSRFFRPIPARCSRMPGAAGSSDAIRGRHGTSGASEW
jgi:formylglycine-generating enzyme required for sulfatase activity